MISPNELIIKLRAYFGENMEMPLAFWRSDEPIAETGKIGGCFFKGLQEARGGKPLSLSVDNIGCGGGKLYLGFTDMPEHVPGFVSLKERYKRTPDDVKSFIEDMNLQRNPYKYFNFSRIDKITSFEGVEGLLFFAAPDVLSGLCGWAFFDNNRRDAVQTIFGSGCSSVISTAIYENTRGGQSCFLGLFDPSVRPFVGTDELGFSIPASRMESMAASISDCFLNGSFAWGKVKERLG